MACRPPIGGQLSHQARDQVVHRRWNPLCLVTALLSTSQPSLRRLSSSVWLSTTHCKPDLSFSKLTPPIFLSIRFSRTWLPSNAKQPNFAMVPHRATYAYTLGARLKPKVVPAKLFQCSRLSGRNKKSSKFIYPPTKPTRTWWQNMLFASLGGPRWYAHICCPARCHVKKTCFQKQFLLEHHWNTAGTSYWNVAGTSTLQQEQSTRKGKMVTYIVV